MAAVRQDIKSMKYVPVASLLLFVILGYSAPAAAAALEFGTDSSRYAVGVPEGWMASTAHAGARLVNQSASCTVDIVIQPRTESRRIASCTMSGTVGGHEVNVTANDGGSTSAVAIIFADGGKVQSPSALCRRICELLGIENAREVRGSGNVFVMGGVLDGVPAKAAVRMLDSGACSVAIAAARPALSGADGLCKEVCQKVGIKNASVSVIVPESGPGEEAVRIAVYGDFRKATPILKSLHKK